MPRPPEWRAPEQISIPYYTPPTYDAEGKPILDYVLAQDAVTWVAQGPIADRSAELLGRTDIPIVVLRRQLDEQISRVEQGKAPMNYLDGIAGHHLRQGRGAGFLPAVASTHVSGALPPWLRQRRRGSLRPAVRDCQGAASPDRGVPASAG